MCENQVKQLASEFFPGAAPNAVLYVTGGKPVQLMRGAADRNVRGRVVYNGVFQLRR